MPDVFQVAEILIAHALRIHGDAIGIVATYGSEFNLLGEYDDGYYRAGLPDLVEPASSGDLQTLARSVQELDERVRDWFGDRSIPLNIFQSKEELIEFLSTRDPIPSG